MPEIQSKHLPLVRDVAALPAQSDMTKVRPLNDQVLIQLEERAAYHGLIELPKTADSRKLGRRAARVIAVGLGARGKNGQRLPMDVHVGQRVLVDSDPGWELPDGYRMLRVGAIHGVLPEGVSVDELEARS